MSALPPKADIRPRDQDVRFGPITDSCSAANDAYSITSYAIEQPRRNSEAERFGGLEIDDELELSGLHNRQVGWPPAQQRRRQRRYSRFPRRHATIEANINYD